MKKEILLKCFVLFISFASIQGCEDSDDVVVPQDISTWESNNEFYKAIKKLSQEDRNLLANYAARVGISQSFGGQGIPQGTTVRQAIEIQRLWKLENDNKNKILKLEEEEKNKKMAETLIEMNNLVKVGFEDFKFELANPEEGLNRDFFSIYHVVKNNTATDVIGFKGYLVIKDIFNTELTKISLSNDEGVPAGQELYFRVTFNYNRFRNEDIKLSKARVDKLKYEWRPEVYIFADGNVLDIRR